MYASFHCYSYKGYPFRSLPNILVMCSFLVLFVSLTSRRLVKSSRRLWYFRCKINCSRFYFVLYFLFLPNWYIYFQHGLSMGGTLLFLPSIYSIHIISLCFPRHLLFFPKRFTSNSPLDNVSSCNRYTVTSSEPLRSSVGYILSLIAVEKLHFLFVFPAMRLKNLTSTSFTRHDPGLNVVQKSWSD